MSAHIGDPATVIDVDEADPSPYTLQFTLPHRVAVVCVSVTFTPILSPVAESVLNRGCREA
jgi:hypothetical protein